MRHLLTDARRAELDVDGLFIDLGTSDQHKYTLGGWSGSWGPSVEDRDGTTHSAIQGSTAVLRVLLDQGVPATGQIAARVRARGGARPLSFLIDGKSVGQAEIGAEWTTARVSTARARLPAGRHELALLVGGKPSRRPVEVDWVWLGRSRGGPPAGTSVRVAPLSFDGTAQRALLAPAPRRYSFFLEVPPRASLVFDHGAAAATRFVVRATAEGEAPRVLFDRVAPPDRWQEAKVDLAPLAGKTVRLDLATAAEVAGAAAGWAEPEIAVPPAPASERPTPPIAPPPARNVIVLVIDTVRADVFRPFNQKSRVRTPAFDKLAAEGAAFVHAYSNENWTKPAVATILSGLYPSTHGAKHDADVLGKDVRLLSELLSQRGFATGSFIANGYVSERFGFRRGWDQHRNYIRENRPSEAEHVFKDALAWVRARRGQRFFLYLQTIDPHVTYAPPAEYVKLYHRDRYAGRLGRTVDGYEQAAISSGRQKARDADRKWIRALYDAEVSYHDTHMGKFFAALAGLGILDDTLVVVTNDHGEEIGERGRYGHGHSLNEELIRAPLVMRYPPAIPAGTRNLDVVENVDLFPTILELLGSEAVSELDGLSLLPLLQGRPVRRPTYAVSEFLDAYRSVRVGRWKYVANSAGSGRLFDLLADPSERRDRAAGAPVARRLCEIHLGEGLATPAKTARFLEARVARRRFKPGVVKLDPALRRQLEALGYFGGRR